jgi:hypothetical protein
MGTSTPAWRAPSPSAERPGSWRLRATVGALQGAATAQFFDAYDAAEFEAYRDQAVELHGEHVTPERFARTPTQRRGDAQSPEPLVTQVTLLHRVEPRRRPAPSSVAGPWRRHPESRRCPPTGTSARPARAADGDDLVVEAMHRGDPELEHARADAGIRAALRRRLGRLPAR